MAYRDRSRRTVDTILEWTTRVLIRDGYDQASTNEIAAVAGVSIGSLYQYFPSKEALVAAVGEHHSQEVLRLIRGTLAQVAACSIEAAAREFVSAAINTHRVLDEEVPRIARLENIEAINEDVYALIRDYLEAHQDEIDLPDLKAAAFFCVTAVDALTHAVVLRRSEFLTDEKAEVFVGEVTDLVIGYLRKSSSDADK